MGPQLRRSRQNLFSVSYTGYRHLPDGSRCDTTRTRPPLCRAVQTGLTLNDVQPWFTHTD